jgi:hypothetical protein
MKGSLSLCTGSLGVSLMEDKLIIDLISLQSLSQIDLAS